MPLPHTYTCPCGRRAIFTGRTLLRRRWGTMDYAPWFQHTCACGRVNTVHEGEALMSIPGRTPTPAKEPQEPRRRDGALHFYVAGRSAFPGVWMLRSLGRLHYFNPFTRTWRACRIGWESSRSPWTPSCPQQGGPHASRPFL